ncbi:hypothetical protein FNV43_RR00134 [Rhamnella rubrinervis]|uniref:Uncharacterized protein n=1 Tax=Rhamnella rubrinervis TaxID=2594499 RepID=A0A8K0HQ17_9ROSA|nr:hypothetical protein FNV43_RR00134 [Rhamnella rubrinervis]
MPYCARWSRRYSSRGVDSSSVAGYGAVVVREDRSKPLAVIVARSYHVRHPTSKPTEDIGRPSRPIVRTIMVSSAR